ncbi:4Fe-4S dicluster domain-containing protein [Desulfuribacillus alkaliarsenatis]|uniref:4Fe-4S ferredoxin-type domain-containing protein n=1 Tax=Desulfuribacillus alkaliarsenatis TaxID=766136 RepID=A0A1E5FZF3_9FIRM|nr:4Fe-4S dicluster domain-containing protein [Desulfuribacillus alkaliarsenatis]OEF95828.1 hypothetical protein BHF68_10550 [Desulfuribacillus alkaliarsenatis]
MKKQLGFLMNLQKCIGCHGCEMACQNEHRLQDHKRRNVTSLGERENVIGFLSMSCNHCVNPACMAICPNKCFKKRRDGIVSHDASRCSGCKSCIGACPFNAPKFNALTGKIDKCNMCINRQQASLLPACVSACIPKALVHVDIPSMENEYSKLPVGIKMAQFTEPSVRFILPEKPKRYLANISGRRKEDSI